ncbi:MAG: hypothetical protein IT449_18570 [Phycisphaerales bacterium]|nr:hypothetical protein [Phycisphaerales bacterium]
MTITEQIEAHVAEAEEQYRSDPKHYSGFDWWQLSAEERSVFAIDPARWPRMMMALAAYDVFLDVTGGDALGYDEGVIQCLRLERADLLERGVDPHGFTQFATAYAGLTLREAAAAYWKNQFWKARTGILTYADELG